MEIGSKVKVDVNNLDLDGLLPQNNASGINYLEYLVNNSNKVYTIKSLNDGCDYVYVLDDEFLKETSFATFELQEIN